MFSKGIFHLSTFISYVTFLIVSVPKGKEHSINYHQYSREPFTRFSGMHLEYVFKILENDSNYFLIMILITITRLKLFNGFRI